MNPIDDQLHRLFRAARAPGSEPVSPPYGLETRALAAWRAAKPGSPALWDMGLLTRAFIVAIVIMGASAIPLFNTTTDPFSAYLQVADTTTTSDVIP